MSTNVATENLERIRETAPSPTTIHIVTAIVSGSIPGLGPIVKFIPADPSLKITCW